MTVVPFRKPEPEPEEMEAHIEGACKCLACGHEWEGQAPIGTSVVDCPECGCWKGTFHGICDDEEPCWTCGCGSWAFAIKEDEFYCLSCAQPQRF